MKIKQAEELVGITSKNIRFYEEQGLLFPERAENGYREYRQQDIETLKKIKLLRKFGVSVEEIKAVLEGKQKLADALSNQMEAFEKEKENISHMENLIDVMLSGEIDISNLAIDHWLDQMEQMEKEGTSFVNISKEDIHMRKKAGAVGGALVILILLLLGIIAIVWGNYYEPIPKAILIFLIALPSTAMIGLVIALIGRMKEIEGGEEDEASKY